MLAKNVFCRLLLQFTFQVDFFGSLHSVPCFLMLPLVVSYAAPVPVIEHSAPALVGTSVEHERTKQW